MPMDMENKKEKPKIRCIFLSEFHPIVGSKIRCQVPENYVSEQIFHAVHVYIIPKIQLQRCVITLNALGFKILGFPIKIDSQKYPRNAFYFNLCFVCDSWVRSNQFEPIVKKLTDFLIMMEEETGFLSKEDEDENKTFLYNIFDQVINDLNNYGISKLCVFENTIHLKIVENRCKPGEKTDLDHMVPLLLAKYTNIDLEEWDLTTQQIIPYINGINHISRIARYSDVELTLVKQCLENLKFYEVVELFPILKYSNIYMCTQNLKYLTKNSQLHLLCKKYIIMNQNEKSKPTFKNIFEFYASFTHGITLKSICQRLLPQNNNIDERKLIIFGLQRKIIRCINKYPIFTGTCPMGRQKYMNGCYSFDEICCKYELPLSVIERDIETDPNVTVICK